MGNTKVWVVVEDVDGKMAVCSSEGSAYRRALQYYVDLLADNFTEIKDGTAEDTGVEDIYEMLLYDLKSLARKHSIDDTLYMREAELFD